VFCKSSTISIGIFFISLDADGFETFYNVILKVIDYENAVQKNNQELAYVHVNGEQIYRGESENLIIILMTRL
jgi:hypothetical protein